MSYSKQTKNCSISHIWIMGAKVAFNGDMGWRQAEGVNGGDTDIQAARWEKTATRHDGRRHLYAPGVNLHFTATARHDGGTAMAGRRCL